jgi:hypothetical protein
MSQIFEKSILQARIESDSAYRVACEAARDAYYGLLATRRYVDPLGKISADTWAIIEPYLTDTNITAMICRKIGGGLYERAPVREMDVVYQPMIDAFSYCDFYQELDEFNAMKVLLGEMYAIPSWDEEDKQVRIMIATPDQIRIIQDEIYPEKADKYMFSWATSETVDGKSKIYTKIMTRDEWWVVEGDLNTPRIQDMKPTTNPQTGEVWADVNPVPGLFPIVRARYTKELGSGMFRGVGLMHEIVPANMALNLLCCAMRVLGQQMGFSTLVFTDVPSDEVRNMAIGAINSVLNIYSKIPSPTGGFLPASVNYISPTASILDLKGAIEADATAIFARFGLRNSNPLRLDVGSPETGIAKWLADAELHREQYRQAPVMARFEKEIARRYMIADHIGKGIALPAWLKNDTYSMTVNFPNRRPVFNLNEQIAREEWLKSHSIINEIDILMESDPDIVDREQAKEYILQRERENIELQRERAKLNPPLDTGATTFDKLLGR